MNAPIYTASYYKVGSKWYLDFPQYLEEGGDPETLERIGFFHDFLEQVAGGASSVSFLFSTEPFDGADVITLSGSSGKKTGGYYFIERFEDIELGIELWMNVLIYRKQNDLPPKIFIKRGS